MIKYIINKAMGYQAKFIMDIRQYLVIIMNVKKQVKFLNHN